MKIALEQLIHVQMGNVRVEEMMYVWASLRAPYLDYNNH